jgi:hypothetical protein
VIANEELVVGGAHASMFEWTAVVVNARGR